MTASICIKTTFLQSKGSRAPRLRVSTAGLPSLSFPASAELNGVENHRAAAVAFLLGHGLQRGVISAPLADSSSWVHVTSALPAAAAALVAACMRQHKDVPDSMVKQQDVLPTLAALAETEWFLGVPPGF